MASNNDETSNQNGINMNGIETHLSNCSTPDCNLCSVNMIKMQELNFQEIQKTNQILHQKVKDLNAETQKAKQESNFLLAQCNKHDNL